MPTGASVRVVVSLLWASYGLHAQATQKRQAKAPAPQWPGGYVKKAIHQEPLAYSVITAIMASAPMMVRARTKHDQGANLLGCNSEIFGMHFVFATNQQSNDENDETKCENTISRLTFNTDELVEKRVF